MLVVVWELQVRNPDQSSELALLKRAIVFPAIPDAHQCGNQYEACRTDQQRRANLDVRTPAATLGFGDPLVANGERRQSPVLWGLLFQAEYHHWLTGSDIGSSHPYIDMKRQLLPDLGVTGPAAWIPEFAFDLFESEMNRIHRLHKPGPLTRQVINEEDLANSAAHSLQRLFGRNIRAEVVEEQRGTDHSASQG